MDYKKLMAVLDKELTLFDHEYVRIEQALRAVERETIERCAKYCAGNWHLVSPAKLSAGIRALAMDEKEGGV